MTARRGTTNRNDRGNTRDRRRRRAWLVETFRADVDVRIDAYVDEHGHRFLRVVPLGEGEPSCRCYRCGVLLTVDTVTADRIVPGCEGGRYVPGNMRPACGPCNSSTGGRLGAARRKVLAS